MKTIASIQTAIDRPGPLIRVGQYRLSPNRWNRWAKSVVEKHQSQKFWSGSLALILAGRAATILNVARKWVNHFLQISPHISLSIPPGGYTSNKSGGDRRAVSPTRGEPGNRRQLPAAPLRQVFWRLEKSQTLAPVLLRSNVSAAAELSRRVVEDRRRVEIGTLRESSTLRYELFKSGPTEMASHAGPVNRNGSQGPGPLTSAMVLNPRPRLDPMLNEHSSPASVNGEGIERPPTTGMPRAMPINIDQITEQVIKQIDHRLVAYRERMGRPGY